MPTVRDSILALLEGPDKPSIPQVLPLYNVYYSLPYNGAGGSLHIVLSDNNVSDSSVEFCIQLAKDNGDEFGELLARLLLRLSKTQRLKLGALARPSYPPTITLNSPFPIPLQD